MRQINKIIIHCTDTPTGRKTTVEDIDSWHKERGFKRDDTYRSAFNSNLSSIGYHFVIYTDGTVHTGRQVAEVGAHASGMNSDSIGISLAGCGVFNQLQWDALKGLVSELLLTYPNSKVMGHYEVPSAVVQGKKCPSFNVAVWQAQGMTPDEANVVA